MCLNFLKIIKHFFMAVLYLPSIKTLLGYTNVKFGFPLCFSMTMLAWSHIEFAESLHKSRLIYDTIDALNWGIQYIRKTHVDL